MKSLLIISTGLAIIAAALFTGCTTTTTTTADGSKTVVHKLDAESTAAVTAALIEALNNPAVQNAITNRSSAN